MNWLEISFHADEDNYELVSQIFIDAGSKGVLIEDSQTPWSYVKKLDSLNVVFNYAVSCLKLNCVSN